MEEEIRMFEQEDAVGSKTETSAHNNSPTKRRRGRPQGSKKLKVCVTDVNLMDLVSGISNGGSTQPLRGRCLKLSGTKHTSVEESKDTEDSVKDRRGRGRPKASNNQSSNGDTPMTDCIPRKRGRPKKTQTPEKATTEDFTNGSNTKIGRGRPKGSVKRKSESLASGDEDESSSVKPRKRGRPKGSLKRKPRLEKEASSEGDRESDESLNYTKSGKDQLRKVELHNSGGPTESASNGVSDKPRAGRGRPRKHFRQKSEDGHEAVTDGAQRAKRGRGRPKGSLNKKPSTYSVQVKVSRPRRTHVQLEVEKTSGSGKPAKRGRPRKYPLPSPEELKKPKVWKPLGRPRKYPRVDPLEGAPPAPRRSRGRPRKSESKKGAHLRKGLPATMSHPRNPKDGPARKRGRPPSTAKSEGVTPRRRGRPKGSLNKNKARSETQLNRANPSQSGKSNSSAAEDEPAERRPQHHKQALSSESADKAEDTLNKQDAVSKQA